MNEAFYQGVHDRLRKDLAECEAEEATLREQLTTVESRKADMRKALESVARLLGESIQDVAADREAASSDDGSATPPHADVAEEELRKIRRPARVSEIASRMADRGHPLPDDERIRDSAVYSAMLRRPNVFTRVGRGLWALTEWGPPHEGLRFGNE